MEGGTKKVVHLGDFNNWNNMEINKCTWIKVRLFSRNGYCSAIANIYDNAKTLPVIPHK